MYIHIPLWVKWACLRKKENNEKITDKIYKFLQYTNDNRFELIDEFTTSKTLRHRISLYLGGAVNFLSIIFYFISGIWYRSTWFFSISVFILCWYLPNPIWQIWKSSHVRYPERNPPDSSLPDICDVAFSFYSSILP